jgi:hypothetical protein
MRFFNIGVVGSMALSCSWFKSRSAMALTEFSAKDADGRALRGARGRSTHQFKIIMKYAAELEKFDHFLMIMEDQLEALEDKLTITRSL